LSAIGGATDQSSGRVALGGLLIIAWVVGVLVGGWRELHRAAIEEPPSATG
jgi:hypothetical protein